MQNSAHRLCLIAFVFSVLVFPACQTQKPSITNTNSSNQTNTSSASKPDERPTLSGLITSLSIYPVPGQPQNLAISLVVVVKNTGAASTVKYWTLEVDAHPNLEPVRVNGVVDLPGTGKRVDLAKEDLELKTAETPIGNGSQTEGVLTFVLSQTSESDLASNNPGFVLHFKDDRGNDYQTPKAVIGRKLSGANTP